MQTWHDGLSKELPVIALPERPGMRGRSDDAKPQAKRRPAEFLAAADAVPESARPHSAAASIR